MADSDKSPADFNPQHRIVGAIILVVAAIIVLPMILDEEKLVSEEAGKDFMLVEEDSKIFVSKAADIRNAQSKKNKSESPAMTDDNRSKKEIAKTKNIMPPAVEEKEPLEKSVTPASKPVEATNKEKKIAKASKPAQKITKGWVVQIGTYSDPANAKKIRATLVRRGYHVRLEKIKLSKGNATRVRVGPFSDRGKAITTLSHIGRDVGLQGVVLRYP